jgi:hypothetical protein
VFEAPDVIQIRGGTGGNSLINGTYFKGDEMHNERVYYHKQDKSLYIFWCKAFNYNAWYINCDLGSTKYFAFLPVGEDVMFPILSKQRWFVYDPVKKEAIEDKNVVVEKITEKVNDLYFFFFFKN